MRFPTDRILHKTAFDGPVVDHYLERKIAQTANACEMRNANINSKFEALSPRLVTKVISSVASLPDITKRLRAFGNLLSLTMLDPSALTNWIRAQIAHSKNNAIDMSGM